MRFRSILIFCLICISLSYGTQNNCFSEINGPVGDVNTKIEDIRVLNNFHILPRMRSLLSKDFFQFYEVNLERPCPFQNEGLRCGSKDCRVKGCQIDELPIGLRDNAHTRKHEADKYSEAANTHTDDPHEEIDCELSKVDKSLSDESRSMLADWKEYDQADDISFCETHDDDSEKRVYVNLIKNPERYTGYKGESSNKLWYMIYNENCFNAESPTHQGPYSTSGPLQCLEKRVFYRLISGFHSSISVHLSYRFPRNRVSGSDSRSSMSAAAIGLIDWGPNLEQFRWRFDPTRVPDADQRLRNLHFVYLVELRALAKAAPYLRQLDYYTGDAKQDAETKQAVNDLLGIVEERGNVFDETQLFSEPSDETVILKRQFRDRFVNISRIMDCVGCDKCRMWGKLQIQGLGTALKILFTERTIKDPTLHKPAQLGPNFHLSRQEIVALFNGFGRLSTSIGALSEFCALMAESTS